MARVAHRVAADHDFRLVYVGCLVEFFHDVESGLGDLLIEKFECLLRSASHFDVFPDDLPDFAALVKGIFKLKAWQMQISWDGGGYDGPAYLLSVCNGPRTGGFQMAPEAQFDDGLYDIVFVPEVPKRTVVAVLLKLMKGEHIHHPAVTYTRTAQITLTSEPGTPIHADGEVFAESLTAVSYHILPGKVTLLAP